MYLEGMPPDHPNYSGTNDVEVVDGALAQRIQSSVYGDNPMRSHRDIAGTAPDVNSGTIVYESADVSVFNHHEFSIVTAPGANSVHILVSHDGTNYEATAIQVFNRALVEGAAVQSLAALTAIGNYYFKGHFKKWKLVNNGATTGAATVIRGSSGNV